MFALFFQTSWLYRIVDHPLFTSILNQLKVSPIERKREERKGEREREQVRGGGGGGEKDERAKERRKIN